MSASPRVRRGSTFLRVCMSPSKLGILALHGSLAGGQKHANLVFVFFRWCLTCQVLSKALSPPRGSELQKMGMISCLYCPR